MIIRPRQGHANQIIGISPALVIVQARNVPGQCKQVFTSTHQSRAGSPDWQKRNGAKGLAPAGELGGVSWMTWPLSSLYECPIRVFLQVLAVDEEKKVKTDSEAMVNMTTFDIENMASRALAQGKSSSGRKTGGARRDCDTRV